MAVGEIPVVFLAFANESDRHLDKLKAESSDVFSALLPLQQEDAVRIHREESVELPELLRGLLNDDGRIVVFHYAGHAGGKVLQLEDGASHSDGLARLLGQQHNLKLVFLNGCATLGHVKLLREAGVPAVIATEVPIGDTKAHEFSVAFYTALAEGRSVSQAFDTGRGYLETKYGVDSDGSVEFKRDTAWEDEDQLDPNVAMPWGLYIREECRADLEQWRLPQARSNWGIQLHDPAGPVRDLTDEPILLRHQARSRTVDALHCSACGTTTARVEESGTLCPVCGSTAEELSVSTELPAQVIPFSVSEETARSRISEAVGSSGEGLELRRVYVPYWFFNVHTRTHLTADRGWNRALDHVLPKMEWEPVREQFDLDYPHHLAAAGAVPQGYTEVSGEWHWPIDQAQDLEKLDSKMASVVANMPVQSAFDNFYERIAEDVEDEVASLIGGHEQRNPETQVRYRALGVRTVMLPVWFGWVTDRAQANQRIYQVNGTTGAVRFLTLDNPVQSEGEHSSMTEKIFEPRKKTQESTTWASAFGAIGIGVMVGAVLGLSHSPVVAQFVGAVGAALAALLGLNDRHFSRAKGVRIGTFGIAVLLTAPLGVYVRDHGLLAPDVPRREPGSLGTFETMTLEEKKALYQNLGFEKEAMGFLESEIKARIAALSRGESGGNGGNGGKGNEGNGNGGKGSGGLHNSLTGTNVCKELAQKDHSDGSQLLGVQFAGVIKENSGTADYARWLALVKAVGAELSAERITEAEIKQVAITARDATCGAGKFKNLAQAPTLKACQASDGQARTVEEFAETWQKVEELTISDTAAHTAMLNALSVFLCAGAIEESE